MNFYFPVPDPTDDYRTNPLQVIAHLLGDEGEGSLLAVLRDAGLADGLSAGVGRGDGNEALFTISISLTPAGAERLTTLKPPCLPPLSNCVTTASLNGVTRSRQTSMSKPSASSSTAPHSRKPRASP